MIALVYPKEMAKYVQDYISKSNNILMYLYFIETNENNPLDIEQIYLLFPMTFILRIKKDMKKNSIHIIEQTIDSHNWIFFLQQAKEKQNHSIQMICMKCQKQKNKKRNGDSIIIEIPYDEELMFPIVLSLILYAVKDARLFSKS